MKRILSLITALVIVLGATSVFAATADWNGYFIVKYRSIESKYDDAAANHALGAAYTAKGTQYSTYAWQKLELYPTWKLSDNVALHAGFFSQNYWGTGRLYGFQTEYDVDLDSGSFKGDLFLTGSDAAGTEYITVKSKSGSYNPMLGVSSAWATLTFMDQKLGIDIGRRLNAEWGTGLFLGTKFSPDRVFITYKESALGGLLMPYFIYEMRNNFKSDTKQDDMTQILFGAVYLKPGKTLIGLTINPNFVGASNSVKADTASGPFTLDAADGSPDIKNGESTVFWAVDVYADHKVTVNEMVSVKPIFEVIYAFGTIYKNSTWQSVANAGFTQSTGINYKADVLNILFKVEVKLKDLATITPEYVYIKAPKSGTATEWYGNIWGANQFCPGLYKIGHLLTNLNGGSDMYIAGSHYEAPARHYLKLKADADILNQFVKGLNAYAAFIYAADLGYRKKAGADITTSNQLSWTPTAGTSSYDKSVVTEIDLGVSYAIDSFTTVGLDFGYAKWGKSAYNDLRGVAGHTAAFTATGVDKRGATEYYLGANLIVKF